MEHGNLYKHIYNTDVAMYVMHVLPLQDGDLLARVLWFNVTNPKRYFKISDQDTVVVKKEHLPNWKLLHEAKSTMP